MVPFSSFFVFVITASQEYVLAEYAEGPFVGDVIVMISGDKPVPAQLNPAPRQSEVEFGGWIEQLRQLGLNVDANVSMNGDAENNA